MGKLVNGRWVSSEEQTRIGAMGEFIRGVTKFRKRVLKDGSGPHPPEKDRYHLLVAHNCPWAHRAIITRNLKGQEHAMSMSLAHYRRNENGWWFPTGLDEFQPTDGKLPLHTFYSTAEGNYSGSGRSPHSTESDAAAAEPLVARSPSEAKRREPNESMVEQLAAHQVNRNLARLQRRPAFKAVFGD